MISPPTFAKEYSSFWNALFPMADALIRTINLNYERFATEENRFDSDPRRRGLLNETGFELARLEWEEPSSSKEETVLKAFNVAVRTLSTLDSKADVSPLSASEINEVAFLARRLLRFCGIWFRDKVTFAPAVKGCGFVDGGKADLIVDPIVCEIKSGDRNFRAIDLRQSMTYAALLDLERPGKYSEICLLNPRRGIYYRASYNDICITAGGLTAAECFSRMVSFMAGAFNSI